MKIILWDIDGTLVRSNGGRVAVNAFLRALCLSCQLEHELPYPYDSAGKTDPQIALEILAAASIAESRASQAPIVRERVRRRLGADASQADIVVVGDTPRDIACARAGGARAVAVAAGNFSKHELQAHRPDVLLDDLTDAHVVVEALLQYSSSLESRQAPIV